MPRDQRLPERIVTARLQLRRPRPSDAPAVFAYASDPDVTLHMDWPTHTAVEQSSLFLDSVDAGWADGSEATWAITIAGDDRMIGLIALRPNGHKADFGYVIARSHWGRGIATEASRAVIEEAFRLPGVTRVWATCSVENGASARVLEKSGLEREGTLRRWSIRPQKGGMAEDSWCYSVVRHPEAPFNGQPRRNGND